MMDGMRSLLELAAQNFDLWNEEKGIDQPYFAPFSFC